MNIITIIPARMGSSRFPGKPMAKILGKPMVGHVYEGVNTNTDFHRVVVATCDMEIYSYIKSIGGEVVMTSTHHERASDRCAEALLKIEKKENRKFDIVVMVQGDEPMTKLEMIKEAIQPMINDPKIMVVNLMSKIDLINEFEDLNCIKVVCDLDTFALYFTRNPIPSNTRNSKITMYKQVCIIPFKRDFLIQYNNLTPTPLEIAESVDMNRVLEHGFKVKMVETNYVSFPVDTQHDLIKVESIMKSKKG